MKISVVKDYQILSQKAAEMVINLSRRAEGSVNICIPAGRTPVGMYQVLVDYCHAYPEAFKHVNWFTLDEYIGIPNNSSLGCHTRLNEQFYQPAKLSSENIFTYNTEVENVEEEAERYERLIQEKGGFDLSILGIGRNGHVGFNEPGSGIDSRTRKMALQEKTIEQSRNYFEKGETPPTYGITLGIGSLLESRSILLFANGLEKKNIVQQLVEGEISSELPASFFKTHRNATLLLDEDAASKLAKV